MARVQIPYQLRDLTDGLDEVEVNASNVRELVAALEERFPGFQGRVTRDGTIAPGLAVVVDNELEPLGLLAKVGETSVVHFVWAIAGGAY